MTAAIAGIALAASLAACSSGGTTNSGTASSKGSAASGSTGSLTTIKLVNTKYDAELLPITAGEQRGTFRKHGIELQTTNVKTSQVAASALISGRADLGLMQAAYIVSADAAGADIVMVGNVLNQLDYHIITAKGITSLQQLAGKKMGDPGPHNGNTATMKAVLDKAGVGADKVTYVTVGAQTAILAALEQNQVQVGLLVAPFTIQARAAGLNDLGTVQKYLPNETAEVIAGTSKTLKSKPDAVRNFLAALIESSQWCAKNPTDAISILMTANKLSKQDATAAYNEIRAFYTKDGTINKAGLQTWIDVALKYGVMNKSVSVDDIYTDKYLPGS